jgi:hypothetical protein
MRMNVHSRLNHLRPKWPAARFFLAAHPAQAALNGFPMGAFMTWS